MKAIHKVGIGFMVVGVLALITGIILGLTYGTWLVPVFLTSSIAINTIGIVLLQVKK